MIKIKFTSGAIFLMVLVGGRAIEARVFRMNNETVATYFGGSYGPSLLKQTHFSGTSGSGVSIDKSFLFNYGAEFGLLFRGPKFGLRLGLESIKPPTLLKAVGSNAGGESLFELESNISALIPKITLEFNIMKGGDSWRAFIALGGGTATAVYKNSYTLTAEGLAAFPGLVDLSEEGTAMALLYDGGLSFETLMNDTTTAAITLGYRKLEVTGYKYKADVVNFTGTHAQGDSVLNEDGTAKKSLYNGPFVSLLFRFYLGK